MSEVEFGWFFPNGAETPDQRPTFVADCDRSLALIRGRFTSAWMADHLQFEHIDILEGWTTLTYFAARHPDLHFGHAVLCESFRNPALLAKMAATFQCLSGGRLIFGLGAGWHEPEYQGYGYPFPSAGTRVDELAEVIAICKAMWTQTEATVVGKHYQIQGAVCQPPPDPLPPLVIGGRRPRIMRLTAQEADWWDVSGFGGVPRADYAALAEAMDRTCATVGRDPASLRRSFSCVCVCAPTEAEVATLAQDVKPGYGLVGTPAQVVEQIATLRAQGVSRFQLAFSGFPATETLELFIAEVLPVVTAANAP